MDIPYVTPGYSAGDVAAASALSFGAGVALGALARRLGLARLGM